MDYVALELEKKVTSLYYYKCLVYMTNCTQERVVVENDHWLVVVPYW